MQSPKNGYINPQRIALSESSGAGHIATKAMRFEDALLHPHSASILTNAISPVERMLLCDPQRNTC